MLAFENDPTQKEIISKQLQAHFLADEIVQGKYWENGKGCAVGCILHSSKHVEFKTRFNIPTWFARLIDKLFEGMSSQDAKNFPLQLWESIQIGTDLDKVRWKFSAYLMSDLIPIVENLKTKEEIKSKVLEVLKKAKSVFENENRTYEQLSELRAADADADADADAARKNAYKRQADNLIKILKEL